MPFYHSLSHRSLLTTKALSLINYLLNLILFMIPNDRIAQNLHNKRKTHEKAGCCKERGTKDVKFAIVMNSIRRK